MSSSVCKDYTLALDEFTCGAIVEQFLASVQCSSGMEDAFDEICDEPIYDILNATHAFLGVSILGGLRLPNSQIGFGLELKFSGTIVDRHADILVPEQWQE